MRCCGVCFRASTQARCNARSGSGLDAGRSGIASYGLRRQLSQLQARPSPLCTPTSTEMIASAAEEPAMRCADAPCAAALQRRALKWLPWRCGAVAAAAVEQTMQPDAGPCGAAALVLIQADRVSPQRTTDSDGSRGACYSLSRPGAHVARLAFLLLARANIDTVGPSLVPLTAGARTLVPWGPAWARGLGSTQVASRARE